MKVRYCLECEGILIIHSSITTTHSDHDVASPFLTVPSHAILFFPHFLYFMQTLFFYLLIIFCLLQVRASCFLCPLFAVCCKWATTFFTTIVEKEERKSEICSFWFFRCLRDTFVIAHECWGAGRKM